MYQRSGEFTISRGKVRDLAFRFFIGEYRSGFMSNLRSLRFCGPIRHADGNGKKAIPKKMIGRSCLWSLTSITPPNQLHCLSIGIGPCRPGHRVAGELRNTGRTCFVPLAGGLIRSVKQLRYAASKPPDHDCEDRKPPRLPTKVAVCFELVTSNYSAWLIDFRIFVMDRIGSAFFMLPSTRCRYLRPQQEQRYQMD